MLRRQPSIKVGLTPLIKSPTPRLMRADGGAIVDHPLMPHVGAINTSTPGRADLDPMHVPPGSYVLPADIVSHVGDGNTAAGYQILEKMFLPLKAQAGGPLAMMAGGAPYGGSGAPYGAMSPQLATKAMGPPPGIAPRIAGLPRYTIYAGPGQHPPATFSQEAHGGVVPGAGVGRKPGTPINASGGEFVIPAGEVKRRGRGDINHGHEILDAWVRQLRQEHIKTLKHLPGPAK